MSLLNMIARKGRKGDSRVNIVDGELAHVNPIEDELIKALGPMGEAFTKAVGSGGINPETGLPEYSWLSKRLTPSKKIKKAAKSTWGAVTGKNSFSQMADDWEAAGKDTAKTAVPWISNKDVAWRPSQGKWGIFGQTEGAKKQDAKKKVQEARRDSYEDFMKTHRDTNVAGIQTPDTNDTPGQGAQFEGDLNKFIGSSGISDNTDDMDLYVTPYDSRKEDEAGATADRALQSQNIDAQQTGNKNSSGMFGLLTQSNTSDSQKNFAGAGNFAMDFSKKQAIDAAEAELDKSTIGTQEIFAGLESDVADLHDEYNEEFWTQMDKWDTAVNS